MTKRIWYKHELLGRPQLLDENTIIEAVFRDKDKYIAPVREFWWGCDNEDYDIIKYRVVDQSEKIIQSPDKSLPTTYKLVEKGSKLKLKAVSGYLDHVNGSTLATLRCTGNGYIAKFESHSSVEQESYLCMDYSQAEYLYMLLKHKFEKESS